MIRPRRSDPSSRLARDSRSVPVSRRRKAVLIVSGLVRLVAHGEMAALMTTVTVQLWELVDLAFLFGVGWAFWRRRRVPCSRSTQEHRRLSRPRRTVTGCTTSQTAYWNGHLIPLCRALSPRRSAPAPSAESTGRPRKVIKGGSHLPATPTCRALEGGDRHVDKPYRCRCVLRTQLTSKRGSRRARFLTSAMMAWWTG
jgi:hypothetical protein